MGQVGCIAGIAQAAAQPSQQPAMVVAVENFDGWNKRAGCRHEAKFWKTDANATDENRSQLYWY
jgi:hypothetical protein